MLAHRNAMHSNERENLILSQIAARGFISFRELESQLTGSPATIRRDLERLANEGKLVRVHGGAKAVAKEKLLARDYHLAGVPFRHNVGLNITQKKAIGKAAAMLCEPGEGVMIDGGSTTLQMCPHLAGLNLQVLTNSLHIVSVLLHQHGTRVHVPSGAVFPEQNIILSISEDDDMPKFHAPKLFMGAASIGDRGLMQADVVLVAAERRLIDRADEIIILADSSKFERTSGNVVCSLNRIDTIITDSKISTKMKDIFSSNNVKIIIAD
jgi:DeoR family transcriptional regulator, ulaG and ulaABCDEF operon transcriptional repressor